MAISIKNATINDGITIGDIKVINGQFWKDGVLMVPDQAGEIARLRADHERVVGELRAEIEALAKDAGRYRWLQKQTPYRFGKIQAACVIDAVDTLYFKADEFDAQIDAAMENGNV